MRMRRVPFFCPRKRLQIEGAQAAWAEQPKDRLMECIDVHRLPCLKIGGGAGGLYGFRKRRMPKS